ncbi:unnamed protein product [Ceratitis capitata]|uniref:(Mediterranean fruit fly) hypothetical protein n=1 Tax=Ceratitis capitata TaxID=7213 RepID=A0A811V0T9_CERCA|nr:unnamed protein product [Ceratitis capitata]
MDKESFDDFNKNSYLKLPKDAGFYWIHCNRCATEPASNSINAMNIVNEVNCPFCKKLTGYRVICNVMPAHVKELLNPEPWHYPNIRILNFQEMQRESFKKGMLRKHYELEKIRRKCKALEIIAKQKYEKYEQLRHERMRLEREVMKLKKLDLKPRSKHLQTSNTNIYNNRLLNMHTFPVHRRESADRRTHNVGHNLSHTALNNSFSLNL